MFSEKPLCTNIADGRRLVAEAEARGLALGCAPDTFLGAGGRLARQMIDGGKVGTIHAGSATLMSRGMEHWHPDPEFFYKPGGGPILDMGPYYITDLVQLLGPIASVVGSTSRPRQERTVATGPLAGTQIPVEVDTHVAGMLEFVSGAVVSVLMSFDVPKHNHTPIEIYGTKGSILVPDPNRFGGDVMVAQTGSDWETKPHTHGHTDGEFRSIGVADMAASILAGRPHRSSGALALHVLEAMEAFQVSSNQGRRIKLETTVERPAMLPVGCADGQLD